MALFNFGKKKVESKPTCSCGGECKSSCSCENQSESIHGEKLIVKVLGGGCAKCNQLEEATIKGINELGIRAEIQHVTDFSIIAQYGVMTTPALVINEKVVSFGKVLKVAEVVEILKKL